MRQYSRRRLRNFIGRVIVRVVPYRWLNGAAYWFHGQFNPPLDAVIFFRYFVHRTTPGVFVECGAYDGTTDSSCRFFEAALHWRGYNLEAMPAHQAQCARDRPLAVNIHAALTDYDGTITFTQAVHPTQGDAFNNGSIAHLPEHRQELDELGCRYEEYTVPAITWATFCTQYGVHEIDLLVLDIEGHEPAVLHSWSRDSVLPKVLVVEAWPENRPIFHSILEPLGYVYDGSYEGNMMFLHNNFSLSVKR